MWKGSPVNSLILGPALLFRMPGISTRAVRPSRSASISIGRNKVGPLVKGRPIQPHERRIIEMAFDDVADIGRLTIAIGAGNIELTAAVGLAIAVVVSFALE